MTISVRFFASLRELVGSSEASLEPTDPLTVQQVWSNTCTIAMPDNTLCAINMEYVDLSQAVKDGDEVAFFPPVTGG
ncbi:MAG: MoaD/ThiS family protein [Gammaproteobacteria bacterium]|nr:MoaD/ThiS family protein [Gammaproteobacteria bacterium]